MAYLRMAGITKVFPGVVANHQVNFEVEQGEVHALVGENGAGKSTLMKILYGLEKPDAGQIFLDEQPVTIPNPQAAIKMGIDMVHQHFQLVPSMTVAENVTLGYEPRRGPFVDRPAMNKRVQQLSEQYGLKVDPAVRVANLSVGVQQRVEILKLLYRNARLLILDEPSAVLTPQEVEDLFEVLQRLVASGRTAILITHKLHEIMTICQRATILRQGKTVGTVKVAETSPAEIAQMMVGYDLKIIERGVSKAADEPCLIVRDLSARDDRGLPVLKNVAFTVKAGEIVGLAGVEGNGQRELLEVLTGLRAPEKGDIILGDKSLVHEKNRQRREKGLAIIPEDRTHEGLSLPSSLSDNVLSTRYYAWPFSQVFFLRTDRMQNFTRQLIQRFDIRVSGPGIAVKTLSGGNAQKVVVARELAEQPRLLLAAQPTRGLDIGATQFVHEELLRLREKDTAILLISADLDELMALSDRFLVMFEGRLIGELSAQQATREALGILMAGRVPSVEEKTL
jgi:simple sugar transport system ATP-binding protein